MLPDGSTLLIFATAALALNLAPGPDMLYVIARSVGGGRGAGLVAALGIFTGCLVHIAAAAFGLAVLLALVPPLYVAIKLAGAAYLLLIGISLVRSAGVARAPSVAQASHRAVFRQGVVTNVLNPKVALFFLAFLPQFVPPAVPGAAERMLVLGLLFNLGGLAVNGAVACGFGVAGDWLRRRPGVWRWQNRLAGTIFVGLALRLALPDRR